MVVLLDILWRCALVTTQESQIGCTSVPLAMPLVAPRVAIMRLVEAWLKIMCSRLDSSVVSVDTPVWMENIGEPRVCDGSSRCKRSKGACPLFPGESGAMRKPKGGTGFISTDVSGEISCCRATREGVIALKVVVVVVAENFRRQNS